MLDSEVDFIILLGRGVMYDFDRTLHQVTSYLQYGYVVLTVMTIITRTDKMVVPQPGYY